MLKINRWTILNGTKSRYSICKCDCGKKKKMYVHNVLSGKSKSCGCYRDEQAKIRGYDSITVHSMSKTPEYRAWICMKWRCCKTTNHSYKYYGARGIRVCDRWLTSFKNFYNDMGKRPSENHTIDRINCDGNYEPDNCKWSTPKEQANNKRNTAHLEYNGETKTLSEWAKIVDLPHKTLCHRFQRNWEPDRLLNQPLRITKVTKGLLQ
jgi:hypothetical protein